MERWRGPRLKPKLYRGPEWSWGAVPQRAGLLSFAGGHRLGRPLARAKAGPWLASAPRAVS
jgi:hypothetical protein